MAKRSCEMTRMYFLLLLNVSVVTVNSVVLDDIVQRYVEKVLCLFQQDMQADWFDHVIQPPTRADGETSPVHQGKVKSAYGPMRPTRPELIPVSVA